MARSLLPRMGAGDLPVEARKRYSWPQLPPHYPAVGLGQRKPVCSREVQPIHLSAWSKHIRSPRLLIESFILSF